MTKENLSVAVIPATRRSVLGGGVLKEQKNIRVAAYCRVSTGDESQQTSYTNQKAFYTGLIREREGWELAGIYADEAISGTSRSRRGEFNRMMEDAKAGHLDYIVTKSISRFARNTVDTLNCVRELRQQNPPVGIYFEKENIDTLDAAGELILTILSALAQDESRSISDNIRWTFQKNFQAGIPLINLKRMIGYDQGADGAWVINPQQARTVQYIFQKFSDGQSANRTAGELNARGWLTVNGKMWSASTVLGVLRNEKFVGDLEMQKTVTKDYLTHRSVKNNGEAPRYYVKDHHPAIVDRVTWNKVQAMLGEASFRKEKASVSGKTRGPKGSLFFNLRCGARLEGTKEICQEPLFRVIYSNSASGYRDDRCLAATGGDAENYGEKYLYAHPVWRCRRKRGKGAESRCSSEVINECALEQSFMEMLYSIKRDYAVRGENSEICRRFQKEYERECMRQKEQGQVTSGWRLRTLEDEIRELKEQTEEMRRTLDRTEAQEMIRITEEEKNTAAGRRQKEGEAGKSHSMGRPLTEILSPDKIEIAASEDVNERMPAGKISGKLQEKEKLLEELIKEKEYLEGEQENPAAMKKEFVFFLECLEKLPEKNRAGRKLNINGLDTQGSLLRDRSGKARGNIREAEKKRREKIPGSGENPWDAAGKEPEEEKKERDWESQKEITENTEMLDQAPDYLPFEKGIYASFIIKGLVYGDLVEYDTSFGVKLVSTGNRRTLGSFIGFRRCGEDGKLELLRTAYQVNGRGVHYRRYSKTRKEQKKT